MREEGGDGRDRWDGGGSGAKGGQGTDGSGSGGGGSSTKGSHQQAGGDGGNGVVLIRELSADADVKGIFDLKTQYTAIKAGNWI